MKKVPLFSVGNFIEYWQRVPIDLLQPERKYLSCSIRGLK